MGIFTFLKYTSPLKYMLEIIYKEEFRDSMFGQFVIEQMDYTVGENACRYVLVAIFVCFRFLAWSAFVGKAQKFT